MNRLGIPRVLLVVLLLIACVDTSYTELMIIAGSGNAALLAQDTRFDPRLQLQSSVQLGVGTRSAGGFEFALGIGLTRATPTSAAVGYSYAGWTGRTMWTRIGYTGLERSPIGIQLTTYGVLAGFDATYLLSFFPIVEIAPTVQVPLPGGAVGSIGLLIGWENRRELGLQIGADFVLPGAVYVGFSAEVRLSVLPAIRTPTSAARAPGRSGK